MQISYWMHVVFWFLTRITRSWWCHTTRDEFPYVIMQLIRCRVCITTFKKTDRGSTTCNNTYCTVLLWRIRPQLGCLEQQVKDITKVFAGCKFHCKSLKEKKRIEKKSQIILRLIQKLGISNKTLQMIHSCVTWTASRNKTWPILGGGGSGRSLALTVPWLVDVVWGCGSDVRTAVLSSSVTRALVLHWQESHLWIRYPYHT